MPVPSGILSVVTTSDDARAPCDIPATSSSRAPVIIDARRHDAVLFDLDGVVTDTATVHARAWTQLFDDFLRRRVPRCGDDLSPFTAADYRLYVDGRSRVDGIRGFLASRGIALSAGECAGDTAEGLARRKQVLFEDELSSGITAFGSAVTLVQRLKAAGIATALYTASMNCHAVLHAAGLENLFGLEVDGRIAAELGLPGKPDPAVLLETARRLVARPDRCVVIEDAQAGVAAGRTGGFGLVVGVGGSDHVDELLACGADAVVTDLAEVIVRPRSPSHAMGRDG
jgi:HAD superfamily hydrolase (TIGR01509 family)